MDGLNIVDLFLKAGWVVQFIIFWLLIFSVISWAIIIQSSKKLGIAERNVKAFEQKYQPNSNLMNLFRELDASKRHLKGIDGIVFKGFEDYLERSAAHQHDMQTLFVQVKETMLNSMNDQLDKLESRVPFLGTVTSVSPYIGLFGTVWGIMDAFIGLGQVKQATLQMVAPGIAEALIATAMGLFAAIPAVLGYNRLNGRIVRIETAYLKIIDRFIADLHKQALTRD